MSAWVQLKGVDLRYGTVAALRGVDLRIAPGERVALVGPNGSGKSSLLRVLHGLLAPSAGTVLRDGAMRQAMVFQRPFALRASALANVALGLWLRGTPWRQARLDAMRALERVELGARALRNARTLSGGELQRLALARAWALDPHVLLLDEPTSALDPHAKREVERLMAEFAAGGTTLVFASHNLGQVKRLASRVVYLQEGRVLADLSQSAFFDGPLGQTSREAELFVRGELG
ncbi:phosphate ABC transporter ATP-binding protein [Ramlibacter ginsenosidimutans]|uniref:Phosphate ABC transporter ATP-binding protein n=1 Tax=Ramlibacter ginsenosidimutans TaxID=502333 RepID=A0A934TTS3_9BURK|nr:phosphate ABC transporter ATP-binding protein [Ramlibacter ginsenosidimutans]MBK6006760.1 phosphate ABC transporter ATP-binding protein [Ramlibacter ginsenosidimutans]